MPVDKQNLPEPKKLDRLKNAREIAQSEIAIKAIQKYLADDGTNYAEVDKNELFQEIERLALANTNEAGGLALAKLYIDKNNAIADAKRNAKKKPAAAEKTALEKLLDKKIADVDAQLPPPQPPKPIKTKEGSIIPAKTNHRINPYKVSYSGKGAEQQADQMLADFEDILKENADAKIAITYSANFDQSKTIRAAYKTGADPNIGGGGQAPVFGHLARKIIAKGWQNKVHILPVSTCEYSGGAGVLTKEHVDADMNNIAQHLGAGWTVLGLQNEDSLEGSYAIGGGVVKGFKDTPLGKSIAGTMSRMTTAGVADSAAFKQGQAHQEELEVPGIKPKKKPAAGDPLGTGRDSEEDDENDHEEDDENGHEDDDENGHEDAREDVVDEDAEALKNALLESGYTTFATKVFADDPDKARSFIETAISSGGKVQASTEAEPDTTIIKFENARIVATQTELTFVADNKPEGAEKVIELSKEAANLTGSTVEIMGGKYADIAKACTTLASEGITVEFSEAVKKTLRDLARSMDVTPESTNASALLLTYANERVPPQPVLPSGGPAGVPVPPPAAPKPAAPEQPVPGSAPSAPRTSA